MGMDTGSSGGKPGRATPSMNVTPLVDVVLVLLIIFMVITPLLSKQFWLHLPNKVEKEQPPSADDKDHSIVVSVTKDGTIQINRENIAEDAFPTKLRRVLAGQGQRTIFFDADDDAQFGDAVKAMDLARGGGASTIAVLTEALPK